MERRRDPVPRLAPAVCADATYSLATKKYLAEGKDGEPAIRVALLGCAACAARLGPSLPACAHMDTRQLSMLINSRPSALHSCTQPLPRCPGYEALAGAPLLCDSDCTPLLPTVIMNHFLLLRTVNRYVSASLHCLCTWQAAC